jgi:aerobic-type carbon monoxide dehydrogenase small subunit (CoxS/CutS family)
MILTVNGKPHDIDAAPDTALLYVLRNDLELNGPTMAVVRLCASGRCSAKPTSHPIRRIRSGCSARAGSGDSSATPTRR